MDELTRKNLPNHQSDLQSHCTIIMYLLLLIYLKKLILTLLINAFYFFFFLNKENKYIYNFIKILNIHTLTY